VKTVFVIAAIIGLIPFIAPYSSAETELTASHSTGNYVPGSDLEITNTIEYTGSLTALGFQATLPEGWSFVSAGGDDEPDIKPQSGSFGTVDLAWITPPSTPLNFSYTV